jgi:hypothetical protein
VTIAEGDRLHYFVQLPGVFSVVDDRPTYEYEDPGKPFGGVYYARLRTTSRGLKVRIQARELDLVETQPAEVLANGLVLAVTIGDDTFSRHLKCTTTLRAVRCVSTN